MAKIIVIQLLDTYNSTSPIVGAFTSVKGLRKSYPEYVDPSVPTKSHQFSSGSNFYLATYVDPN